MAWPRLRRPSEPGDQDAIAAIYLSPTDQHLATIAYSGLLTVYQLGAGPAAEIHRLEAVSYARLSWSATGKSLAFIDAFGSAAVLEGLGTQPSLTYLGPADAVAFHPGGNLLILRRTGLGFFAWSDTTYSHRDTSPFHLVQLAEVGETPAPIQRLAVSPDGKYVAWISAPGRIEVLALSMAEELDLVNVWLHKDDVPQT